MWFFKKKKIVEVAKPKQRIRCEAAYPLLSDAGIERYVDLASEINHVGEAHGLKAVVMVLLKLILRLDERIKELEHSLEDERINHEGK